MKITEGNLLDDFDNGKFQIIIHGCNCHHAMAAGIAGQIAKKYPQAVNADMNTKMGSLYKLGNYSAANVGKGMMVINLYSQFFPGKDLSENALLLGFEKLAKVIPIGSKIGIPEIGCGIAGGNWDEIGPKIEYIMRHHDITLVKFKKQKDENTIKKD